MWIDEHTLAVGRGLRTNAEGVSQIRDYMRELDVRVVPVHLPYHTGPQSCLHLQSLISLVDVRTAVVHLPLMPVAFYEFLLERDFYLIEVPEAEFESMGPNILAISPGKLVMLEGNPFTKRRLEDHGYQVYTYKGEELSLRSEGGATCLTRPILRRS